ncbi:MAG: class B sortase [Lachnospiraceae bacterium]|nr:class B sortase [Lachnospiraceae bacterium]
MKKNIINGLTVICLLVMVGCGGYLAHYFYNSRKSENAVNQLRDKIVPVTETNTEDDKTEKGPEMVSIDGVSVQKKFEQLYTENHDFMGWLTIEDTNVDYPVMYTPGDSENGEYYIHRDFEGAYSAAGLPFIDKNCDLTVPTDNVIIYGHNMNSGKMFRDLLKYDNAEFYEAHKTFTFDTIYGDGTYEVIAAFYGQILDEDSTAFKYYEFVNAGTEEEFMNFVDQVQNMSVVDTGVEVHYGEKLLTLSTCAYHVKDGRFAVVARKLE